jgi:serine/threonine protein kinase
MHAVISDLSLAEPEPVNCDTDHPAHIWTAPEVRSYGRQQPYSYAMDIWSLGLCWLDTFCPEKLSEASPIVSMKDHAWLRMILSLVEKDVTARDPIYKGLFELLKQMLRWNPSERPTMRQALNHRAWDTIAGESALRSEDALDELTSSQMANPPSEPALSEAASNEPASNKPPSNKAYFATVETASEDSMSGLDEQSHNGHNHDENEEEKVKVTAKEKDTTKEKGTVKEKDTAKEQEKGDEKEDEREEWNGFPSSPELAEHPTFVQPNDDAETPGEVADAKPLTAVKGMAEGTPTSRNRRPGPITPARRRAASRSLRPPCSSKRARSVSPRLRGNAEVEARPAMKKARLGSRYRR